MSHLTWKAMPSCLWEKLPNFGWHSAYNATKMNMSAHIKILLDTSGESRYHKSAPSFAHMYSHVFKRVANRFRDFNWSYFELKYHSSDIMRCIWMNVIFQIRQHDQNQRTKKNTMLLTFFKQMRFFSISGFPRTDIMKRTDWYGNGEFLHKFQVSIYPEDFLLHNGNNSYSVKRFGYVIGRTVYSYWLLCRPSH